MKKSILGVLALLLVAGTAYAYFTSQVTVPIGVIKTASLALSATEVTPLSSDIWTPGEARTSTWKVTNTGSIPLYAKGYLDGSWEDNTLSNEVVKTIKIERKVGEDWVVLLENSTGISEEFFHSQDGTGTDLLSINPAEETEYRFTTMLDAQTGDEYQLQQYELALHLATRQVTNGAIWPVAY
jgi:predicted ribosomally synthesized peptide with SipW-like signal peptide